MRSLRRFAASLVFGTVIAFFGIVLHNDFPPIGLLLALSETAVGIWMVGRYFGRRIWRFYSLLAWLALVLRAGTNGAGHEILVYGNTYGNLYLAGGLFVSAIAIAVRV